MKKIGILICIVTLLSFFTSCSNQPAAIQGIVTFIHGNLKINGMEASVGSRAQKGDILTTAGDSLAVVQISQTAVITLRSNAELKFDDLKAGENESQTVLLNLTKGSTFHKVIRKGSDYSVKTPTIVASVRGTSFEVNVKDSKSRVSLLNGKVKVIPLAGEDKAKELIPEQFVEATPAELGEILQLAKEDKEILAQLDSIAAVVEVEKITQHESATETAPGFEVIKEPVKEKLLNIEKTDKTSEKKSEIKTNTFIPDGKAVNALIKNENRTISDIKAVFQRIDEIRLFSGRVIQGAITERGERYTVITTTGVIKLSEGEIQTVRVVR